VQWARALAEQLIRPLPSSADVQAAKIFNKHSICEGINVPAAESAPGEGRMYGVTVRAKAKGAAAQTVLAEFKTRLTTHQTDPGAHMMHVAFY